MSQDEKLAAAHEYAQSLQQKIKSFRAFDSEFEPLDEEIKKKYFRIRREAGWPVLKKAIFVMDRDGKVMTFYRHPMETSRMKKVTSATPINTYGLTSYNSIVVYGDADVDFSTLAKKRIQGWPIDIHIIPAGIGYAVVAKGYQYFFEVHYAVVPPGSAFNIGGVKVAFMDLENVIDIMNSHGLESKEMEINIAKCLCQKR